MGYTHYWNFKKKPSEIKNADKKFAKAVELIKEGIKKIPSEITIESYNWQTSKTEEVKMPFALAGWNGTGEPVFTNTKISFNGRDDDNYDGAYESCVISLNDDGYEFNFCKTAQRPYDIAVCLSLLCLKKCFGRDFTYSSDGTKKVWGWKMANEIFKTL